MSRLDFAPEPKQMEVTDIATGHLVFRPVPGKQISYTALDKAIRDAGYEIEDAAVDMIGIVTDERHLRTPNGQVFHLTAPDDAGKKRLAGLRAGREITLRGAWKAVEGGEAVVVTQLRERSGETR